MAGVEIIKIRAGIAESHRALDVLNAKKIFAATNVPTTAPSRILRQIVTALAVFLNGLIQADEGNKNKNYFPRFHRIPLF